MPLLQPTARDDASAAVGAQRAEAMRVGDRLDRMEKIEVREIVHVDTILQYDNNTLAAHAHRLHFRAKREFSNAAILVVIPDHYLVCRVPGLPPTADQCEDVASK
mmetsp:Transcript_25293/g.69683  ORF Transcript_25293/g.69683 Transcript_25293/m.69683 type:complete len:105 (+) Transcript_25293:1572-1886(+)